MSLLVRCGFLAMRMQCVLVAAGWFVFISVAAAQAWPVKPVRVIVNFPAGGTTDMMARAWTQKLSEVIGQPVVIENRGGAGGNVGMEAAARAAPDGYTLLASSGSPVVIGQHLYKLSIDIGRDLVPIAPMGRILTILVVRPSLPVKSTQELIGYMRANPGKLNYGSAAAAPCTSMPSACCMPPKPKPRIFRTRGRPSC